MLHAKREEIFSIGSHAFEARDVCAPGSFRGRSGRWEGPPRADLRPRFERWTRHLLTGLDVDGAGRKGVHHSAVQVRGGFQNLYIFAERGPECTTRLWEMQLQSQTTPEP